MKQLTPIPFIGKIRAALQSEKKHEAEQIFQLRPILGIETSSLKITKITTNKIFCNMMIAMFVSSVRFVPLLLSTCNKNGVVLNGLVNDRMKVRKTIMRIYHLRPGKFRIKIHLGFSNSLSVHFVGC